LFFAFIVKDEKEIIPEKSEQRSTSAQSFNKKKDHVKRLKKQNKKNLSTCEDDNSSNNNTGYAVQLENKLKWAVDEVYLFDLKFILILFFYSWQNLKIQIVLTLCVQLLLN
jgi:hypothetical protein